MASFSGKTIKDWPYAPIFLMLGKGPFCKNRKEICAFKDRKCLNLVITINLAKETGHQIIVFASKQRVGDAKESKVLDLRIFCSLIGTKDGTSSFHPKVSCSDCIFLRHCGRRG